MIKIRRNFETNSSSMHSLAFTTEDGDYTAEELKRIDDIAELPCSDVILTLNEDDYETLTCDGLWIWSNRFHFWSNDFEFHNTAMEVLNNFRSKLRYYIASIIQSRYSETNKQKMLDDVKSIILESIPDVEIELDINDNEFQSYRSKQVNNLIMFKFLKMNNVSVKEFLTNRKYAVIVDYQEFLKMQFLNMVDMSKVVEVFCEHDVKADNELNIDEEGAWVLTESSISFGRYPFRVLGTPEGKARYALASERGQNADEVLAILQEVYPNMKSIKFPRSQWASGGIEYGYVEDCAIPRDVSLRDFLLNKKYVIISDGDEYCIWSGFTKTSLFNKEAYQKVNDEEDED